MLAQPVSVVEPNKKLIIPYKYLPLSCKITRVSTIEQALRNLSETNPKILFLSASFSASKSLKLL